MWKANPARIWRDVSETSNREDRLDRVKQAAARVKAQLDSLGSEASTLEAVRVKCDKHPGSEPGAARTSARLMFVAAVLIALDIPVQYLLNSAGLPGISAWKVLIGSVALPIGIAAVIHYIVEPLIYDVARPARSIRIAKTLAASALLAVVVGATVFLFARQASGEIAGYIVSLTAASLWAVAEALPLTAGFVAMWAHMLAKPSLDAARLRMVKERIATWERLLERLTREEVSLINSEEAPVRGRDRLEPVRLTSAILFLISCVGVMPATASAQATRTCAVFVDRSRSVDSVHREMAIRLMLDASPQMLSDRGCTRIIAGTFADEGEFAPRRLLDVPQFREPNDCQLSAAPALEGSRAVLLSVKGLSDHFRREVVEKCRRERSVAILRSQREWATFRADIGSILGAAPTRHITKTHILRVITNVEQSSACALWVVTDAIDDALKRSGARARYRDNWLTIVMVPAAHDYGGADATRRAVAAWLQVGAKALPYTALVDLAQRSGTAVR